MPTAHLIIEIHGMNGDTRIDASNGGVEHVFEKRVAQLIASVDEGVSSATASVPCTHVACLVRAPIERVVFVHAVGSWSLATSAKHTVVRSVRYVVVTVGIVDSCTQKQGELSQCFRVENRSTKTVQA